MKFTTNYLSDVVSFQEGPGVRKFQFRNKGVKLLNVGNINKGILDTSTTKLYISEEEAYGKYKHFLVDEGDLLIASSGIIVDNFHNKIAYVKKEHLPLCLNTSTIRFKSLDKSVFYLDYLKFYLKTTHFKSQLRKLITGAAQLNFGPSHLKKITIPVPSLQDQLYIANLLTKVENLIVQRKESIVLVDEFLKSTFLEMFGDPESNPYNFSFMDLETLCSEIVDCPHSTPIKSKEITNYPCIRTSELINGYIYWDSMQYLNEDDYIIRVKRLIPKEGDIVYGREGTYGEAVRIPATHNFSLGQRTMLFRPDYEKTNSIFLWAIVRSEFVYKQAKKKNSGSTVGHVNVKDIKQFRILNPPIELQNNFSKQVKKIEFLKTQYQQSLQELENLYGSLSQRAFNGELVSKDEKILMAAEPMVNYLKRTR
jgi:type I restriction enzyme, S subunit